MANTMIAFYQGMLKGNYIKGANTLEGIMRNIDEAAEITSSIEAMSIIFEPMNYGGNKLLPNSFFGGMFYIGRGYRNIVRAADQNFDPYNLFENLNTLDDIITNESAMNMINESPVAIEILFMSSFVLSCIVANSEPFNIMISKSNLRKLFQANKNNILGFIFNNANAANILLDNVTAMNEIFSSGLIRVKIVAALYNLRCVS